MVEKIIRRPKYDPVKRQEIVAAIEDRFLGREGRKTRVLQAMALRSIGTFIELAAKMGVEPSWIHKILRSEMPTLLGIQRLAVVLEVSVSFLTERIRYLSRGSGYQVSGHGHRGCLMRKGTTLFVAGQVKDFATGVWEFQGVFENPTDADRVCLDETYFFGPVVLNTQISDKSLSWPGIKFPRQNDDVGVGHADGSH